VLIEIRVERIQEKPYAPPPPNLLSTPEGLVVLQWSAELPIKVYRASTDRPTFSPNCHICDVLGDSALSFAVDLIQLTESYFVLFRFEYKGTCNVAMVVFPKNNHTRKGKGQIRGLLIRRKVQVCRVSRESV